MVQRSAPRDPLIQRAKIATQESKQLDFKGKFEDTHECWCGLVKDIVAMANSGGGILVFGLNSDGTPTGKDSTGLLTCDISTVTNKVFKWTNYEFAELETVVVARETGEYPALIVGETEAPIPFTKRGEWETADKKKKIEFVEGSVYFRHGASSAPATRADFTKWIERYASRQRKLLMQGVKKIVAAPPGHVVAALPTGPTYMGTGSGGLVAQLSNDPNAMKVIPKRAADFYPYRGVELRERVNKEIKGTKLSAHDLTSINRAFNVIQDRPEFATRPHDKASPQFSETYAQWIVKQVNEDSNFVPEARNKYTVQQKAKAVAKARRARRRWSALQKAS